MNVNAYQKEAWSFWDDLSLTECLLDCCDTIFIQIKDIIAACGKQRHESFAKFNRVVTYLSEISGVLYCFNFIGYISFILSGKFLDKQKLILTASSICMLISEILTPIYWLHEKGIIYLGKSAHYIGKGITLFEGCSYALAAIADVKMIVKSPLLEQKVRATLNIIWFGLWVLSRFLESLLSSSLTLQLILSILFLTRTSYTIYDKIYPLN